VSETADIGNIDGTPVNEGWLRNLNLAAAKTVLSARRRVWSRSTATPSHKPLTNGRLTALSHAAFAKRGTRMPLPATSPRAVASFGHGGSRVTVSAADLAKVGPHGYIHGWIKVGTKPDEIPVKSSDDVKTIGDLHSFAAMVPAASGDGKVEFFTHAVRSDASVNSIVSDGIHPDSSGNVYLSKPPMIRDLGAGYVIAQHPAGKARASTDVVSSTERYPQYTVDGVHPDDIVKVVREVPYNEGGHSIREDDLAAYATSHQGLDDEDVRSLPAKYRSWFHLADVTKDAADLHDPTRVDGEHVFQQLLANYPPHAIEWVKTMPWIGPVKIPLDRVDWAGQDSWAASHQTKRVKKFQKRIRGAGKDVNPVIMVQVPGNDKCVIIDGHHRGLAFKNEGRPVKAYVGMADSDEPGSPWFQTHDYQYAHGGSQANKSAGSAGTIAVRHDILAPVAELSPESGVVKAAAFPTLWQLATAPDLVKVGKEGYIHGWVCVSPPCGHVGDKVTHPVHGDGVIRGVNSDGSMIARFSDGTFDRLGDEASPVSTPRVTSVVDSNELANRVDDISDNAESENVMGHLDDASDAFRSGDVAGGFAHLAKAKEAADRDHDSVSGDINELRSQASSSPNVPEKPSAPVIGHLTPADIGPFGDKITKLSGDEASQQDVLSALKALPAAEQQKLLYLGHIRGIQVGNRLPGLTGNIIGSLDQHDAILRIKPDDEAGDTALHEVMHAYDNAHMVTGSSGSNGWFMVTAKLERNYPQMFSHFSNTGEGRKVADQEKFAELASQYLRGKPFNLGPNAFLNPEDTAMVEKFFAKIKLNRV
jgi:hypothetical protein